MFFELVYSSSCRPVPAVLPGAGGFLLFFRWKIVPSSPSSPWPHSKTASSPSAECSSLSHAKGRGDHPAPRQICDGWTELTGAARVSLDFWYLFIWMIYWLIFTSLHHFHQLLPVCPGFSRHNCLRFFGQSSHFLICPSLISEVPPFLLRLPHKGNFNTSLDTRPLNFSLPFWAAVKPTRPSCDTSVHLFICLMFHFWSSKEPLVHKPFLHSFIQWVIPLQSWRSVEKNPSLHSSQISKLS